MAHMESNIDGREIELFVSVENDGGGVFLSISGNDEKSGEELFDYIATNVQDIDAFFTAVDRAKAAYKQLSS